MADTSYYFYCAEVSYHASSKRVSDGILKTDIHPSDCEKFYNTVKEVIANYMGLEDYERHKLTITALSKLA